MITPCMLESLLRTGEVVPITRDLRDRADAVETLIAASERAEAAMAQDMEWALVERPRREVPAKPVYIDDATGAEVDADWWPGDPLPE